MRIFHIKGRLFTLTPMNGSIWNVSSVLPESYWAKVCCISLLRSHEYLNGPLASLASQTIEKSPEVTLLYLYQLMTTFIPIMMSQRLPNCLVHKSVSCFSKVSSFICIAINNAHYWVWQNLNCLKKYSEFAKVLKNF